MNTHCQVKTANKRSTTHPFQSTKVEPDLQPARARALNALSINLHSSIAACGKRAVDLLIPAVISSLVRHTCNTLLVDEYVTSGAQTQHSFWCFQGPCP